MPLTNIISHNKKPSFISSQTVGPSSRIFSSGTSGHFSSVLASTRITDVTTGQNGVVRMVSLKNKNMTLSRPEVKVLILTCNEEQLPQAKIAF